MKLRPINELPPRLKNKLAGILSTNYRADARGVGRISQSSSDRRESHIYSFYRVIHSYQFEIKKPENIKQKHIRCWIKHHLESGTKPETILQYCSHLKVFVGWIGKNELLLHPRDLIDGVSSGRRNRTKPRERLLKSLNEIVEANNRRHSKLPKVAGEGTQAQRRNFYNRFFSNLNEMGFKLTNVHSLTRRHIQTWMQDLEAKGRAPATLQKHASMLNVFCNWIGKEGMMGDARMLLRDPANFDRKYILNLDKTDTASGVTVAWPEMLSRVHVCNPRLAAQYAMMKCFGLRFEEALKIRPNLDDKVNYLVVKSGTKGGKLRKLPIDTEEQRIVLNTLKLFAVSKNGSTIPKKYDYKTWKNYARSVNRRLGFTQKGCGYTPHALRHGYINEQYKIQTGHDSPVKGGDPRRVGKHLDITVRKNLSHIAGHGRVSITSLYLGSTRAKNLDKHQDTGS